MNMDLKALTYDQLIQIQRMLERLKNETESEIVKQQLISSLVTAQIAAIDNEIDARYKKLTIAP